MQKSYTFHEARVSFFFPFPFFPDSSRIIFRDIKIEPNLCGELDWSVCMCVCWKMKMNVTRSYGYWVYSIMGWVSHL